MAEIRQIQVDGVNYDLVISEDEVSATAAAQSAAQALQYRNQAQTSAAQAGQQATNASNQADRAEDAADRAEAIVGGQFVSYGEDQGLTDANKAQARKNIGAANTNPNLLRNWYWVGGGSQQGGNQLPVNSRCQTTYSNGGYTIDGWMIDGGVTITIESSGLRITASSLYTGLFTRIPANKMNPGETYTVSIIVDGVLHSATFTADGSGNWSNVLYGTDWYVPMRFIDGVWEIKALNAMSVDAFDHIVASVKLEKGSVSTLEAEPAPDYEEELAKCIFSKADRSDALANNGYGRSNRNLLDNWYFVGGGSQLGDGVFPINQRAQTSYSAYTNSIDRWYAAAAMTIAADGISCGAIVQKLPHVENLNGKTLTFSALLADGTMLSGSAVFNSASDTYFYYDAGAGEHLLYNTYFGGVEVVTARKIAAVKLEYGTVSTLANDAPPDFVTELANCKAYFQRVKQPQGYTAPIGFGIIGASSNILRTLIPLSSPLRDATSITASATNIGQMKVWGNGSYFTPSAITGRTVLNGHAVVDITVSGSLQNYMVYHIILQNASIYIDLSAEL